MQKIFLVMSLGFLGVIMAHQAAHSQTMKCGYRAEIIERLATRYGETRQTVALNPQRGIVEMFASSDTGTWTLLITLFYGRTCLIAAGEAYEHVQDAAPIPGDDA